MQNQARNQYQQSEVLDADPMRLILLLYRGAIEAVGRAREHQAKGEIRERSRQITRAFEMVSELASAVDQDKGGELAVNLLKLYDYLQHELLRANAEQSVEVLGQVEAVLKNLAEGWEALCAQNAAQGSARSAYTEDTPRQAVRLSA